MKKIVAPAAALPLLRSLLFRVLFCLFFLAAGMGSARLMAQKQAVPAAAQKATPAFTYKVIPAANGTYGYDIYADGKLRIHQPAIPAMPGNAGFTTREAAEKVAGLVISKMKKGESLPTISPEELKKLKAI